jgi:hypothetical protein
MSLPAGDCLATNSWRQLNKLELNHVTTDGQSASQSSCQAPSGTQDKIYVTDRQFAVLSMWGTEERTGPSSESESELLYDWRFTPNQFVFAPSPLRLTASNILFSAEPLRS